MRRSYGFAACLLVGLLAFPCTAFADPDPMQAADGNQISQERLDDSIIEYEELGSLIHVNNVTVQNIAKSSELRKQEYLDAGAYLRSEKASAGREKDNSKANGDMESYVEYASYEAIYTQAIKSYDKMVERLNRYSSNKQRASVEKQLTNAAQSLMISYQSLSFQNDYLVKMTQVLEEQYENTKLQLQAGLAADLDVQNAYNRWAAMESSLQELENGTNTLYQNLCLLLGVDETGSMEIQEIPSTDVQQIEELHLEEDTKTAVNNHPDVISARNNSAYSTGSIEKKKRTLSELEEKVTVKMKALYDQVMNQKMTYESAKIGYESAQITWNNAENKYRLGMLSKAEYLAEEAQYLQKQNEYRCADLELLQALEAYQWAVKGIVELE